MTETPKYSVIMKDGDFELRLYPSYIKAEVKIKGHSYRRAIFEGFRILADYIFGNNTANNRIAMTSPVQISEGQKIAMTKPVTIKGDGIYTVAFIMPSAFSMMTLPKPKNPDISFSKAESKSMAAIRFSGFYRKRQIEKAEKRLRRWLEKENIPILGEFIAAGYNPPWVPWFLSRNEVMIEVRL